MDQLSHYRNIIKQTLTDYQAWASNAAPSGIEDHLAFDETRDHYFWFQVGWNGKQRVSKIMVYLRLQNGKIWIEEDWTEKGIADDLLRAGVLPEAIVLGFQHPTKRSLTEFATL